MKKKLKGVFQEERRPCCIYHYKCSPLVNECTNTMNQKRNRKSSHFLSPPSAYVTFQENLKMHTWYWAQHTWLVNHCIFVTLFGQWQLKPPRHTGKCQERHSVSALLPAFSQAKVWDPVPYQPRKWGANFITPLLQELSAQGFAVYITKYGRELQPTDKFTC